MATGSNQSLIFETLNSSFPCCCSCHASPLYHYRKSPDLATWYSHLNNVLKEPVRATGANAPEYATANKEYFETLSKGHNGGSPSSLSNIATITLTADLPSILRG
jgi:hypothetical protein